MWLCLVASAGHRLSYVHDPVDESASKKLRKGGIKGRFLEIVMSMYSKKLFRVTLELSKVVCYHPPFLISI